MSPHYRPEKTAEDYMLRHGNAAIAKIDADMRNVLARSDWAEWARLNRIRRRIEILAVIRRRRMNGTPDGPDGADDRRRASSNMVPAPWLRG